MDKEGHRPSGETQRADQQALFTYCRHLLTEQTVEGLLRCSVDVACDLAGARFGVAGQGFHQGTFRVRVTSRSSDGPPPSENEVFSLERHGIYLDIMCHSPTWRISRQELQAHPAWSGLPEAPATLGGVLGARLIGRNGEGSGLIVVSGQREGGEFSAADEAIVGQVATTASLALHQIEDRQRAAVLRHVTEHVRAWQEVEELAARDRAILESMSEGLVIFDLHSTILEMNLAAARLHGMPSVDKVFRHFDDYVENFELYYLDGRPVPTEVWPLPRVLRGEAFVDFDVRAYNRSTHTTNLWSYSGTPILDRDGNIVLGVLTMRDITRQIETEAELQRQLIFLDQLIAEAPVGIAVVGGAEHRYELANAHYQALPGTPGTPLVGRTVCEVFPDPSVRPGAVIIEEVYRTGEAARFRAIEATAGPGRESTYWNIDHVPLFGPNAQVERVLVLAHEVTDQVRAHQQLERVMADLAEEEARFQAIVQNAPVGIVLADAQARILLSNPAADRLSGGSTRIGLDYDGNVGARVCHPNGTPYNPCDLPLSRSALDGETWQDVEVRMVWPDGQHRDLLVNTTPIRSASGEILGALGTMQDITERNRMSEALRRAHDELEQHVLERTRELLARSLELQRANEELRAAQEQMGAQHQELLATQHQAETEHRRYQELFQFAPDGYLLTDPASTIVEANHAARSLLHLGAQDPRGATLRSCVLPADAALFDDSLEHLVTSLDEQVHHWEMRFQPAEGQVIHAAVAAAVSRTATGEIAGLRWLLRDVTHDKQIHAALVRSEKLSAAGQLAASLVHEINNPLSAALGYVDLIQDLVAGKQDPANALNLLNMSLERTSRVVTQLRQLHGQAHAEERQLGDLNDLVESVLFLASKKAMAASVEISWTREDDLPLFPLMVDGMQQVFLNLVLNAIDAMDEGGQLTVRIRRTARPHQVGIEFADTGPGLAPRIQDQIFEPFKTTKSHGSGLGLFVSQNIVQQHGGEIQAHSTPGQGTTFTVWLPA